MVIMLDGLKHHDGQLLVRRKDDVDELQVGRRDGIDGRDEGNANKQSDGGRLTSRKSNGRLKIKVRVG